MSDDQREISHDDYLKLLGLMTLAKEHERAANECQEAMERLIGEADDPAGGAVSDGLWGMDERDPKRAVAHVLRLARLTVAED